MNPDSLMTSKSDWRDSSVQRYIDRREMRSDQSTLLQERRRDGSHRWQPWKVAIVNPLSLFDCLSVRALSPRRANRTAQSGSQICNPISPGNHSPLMGSALSLSLYEKKEESGEKKQDRRNHTGFHPREIEAKVVRASEKRSHFSFLVLPPNKLPSLVCATLVKAS